MLRARRSYFKLDTPKDKDKSCVFETMGSQNKESSKERLVLTSQRNANVVMWIRYSASTTLSPVISRSEGDKKDSAMILLSWRCRGND